MLCQDIALPLPAGMFGLMADSRHHHDRLPLPKRALLVEERPTEARSPQPRRWPALAAAGALHLTVAAALLLWTTEATPPQLEQMVVELVQEAPEPPPLVLPEPTPPPMVTEVSPPEVAEAPPPEPEPEALPALKPEPPPPPKPKVARAPKPAPAPVQPAAAPIAPAPVQQATVTTAPPAPAYVPPTSSAAYLNNPKPAYPRLARQRGMQGVVLLSVRVDAEGRPLDVDLKQSSGFSVLDGAARDAVAGWRFVPASRGGKPIEASVEVPVRFSLEG